jgi:hypothetical protein
VVALNWLSNPAITHPISMLQLNAVQYRMGAHALDIPPSQRAKNPIELTHPAGIIEVSAAPSHQKGT